MRRIKNHLLELLCCLIVLLAALNTTFKEPVRAFLSGVERNNALSGELREKERRNFELDLEVRKAKNSEELLESRIQTLENNLKISQNAARGLESYIAQRTCVDKKQPAVVVHDDETSYQVWSQTREMRRQAAKERWK